MILLSVLNSRAGKLLGAGVLMFIAYLWFNVWLSTQKAEAVKVAKQKIEQSTIVQVKQDEVTVNETYSNVTDGMRARADARMQQYQTAKRDRLQRFSSSERTTFRPVSVKRLDGSNVLSDKEIAAIRKHADLLQ